MRVLIWSPNYAPEPTGIPPIVTDAAEWLVERGQQVDVVTALPNYPERKIHAEYRGSLFRDEMRNGVAVYRSWLRARPERSFLDKALYEVTISTFALPSTARLIRSAEVVVCVVPTILAATYAAALTRIVKRRFVLWVQDLVVDAAASVASERFATGALAVARKLEDFAIRRADRIVVCSPAFRGYFVSRGVDGSKIETIYNWADVGEIRPHGNSSNGRARFLYAGNIGFTQGVETLIDAAEIGGDAITVEIVGAGNARDSIRERARRVRNVTLRDPVPRSAYPALLASADAHVVMQRKISAGANLPSKIATYMASGRPIVASIDAGTPAADLLRASGGAVLVEPESPADLASAMKQLAADLKLRQVLGQRGRAYAERHLAKGPALERLEQVFCG